LTDAGKNYRQHRDYPSLQMVTESLKKGMSRRFVESLLGEADYSPTDGVYCYSSDRMEYSEEAGREFVVGLIVEYRTESGKVTDRLESWQLGPIGE
jgi:hypothetical protein